MYIPAALSVFSRLNLFAVHVQWLSDYCSRIAALGVFADKTPNHVLVNEYTPGQGIMVRTVHTCNDYYYYYTLKNCDCGPLIKFSININTILSQLY